MTSLKAYAQDFLQFVNDLIIPAADGPSQFGSVMQDHQREWFEAIAPAVQSMIAGDKPKTTRYWSERSKGASKDTDAACVLLHLLLFCPRKLEIECGANDREQANELKKALVDLLRLNPRWYKRIEVQQWSLINRATNSECRILSSDVFGAHGSRPSIVLLNELSHIQKEDFAQTLLDNLSKSPNGLGIILTNAGFTGSWQSRWRDIARDSDRWHFHQFAQPAPWIDDAELEEAESRNSLTRFRRLYHGDWVSQSGDALDQTDIDAALNQPPEPREELIYFGGLDLGIKQDHSAFVVIGASRKTLQLQLIEAQSWKPDAHTRKVDLIELERYILQAHHRYNIRTIGYDPYECELLSQRLTLQQVPMTEMRFTGQNLNKMASCLLETFRARRISLFNHHALVADLQKLQIEEKSYGHRLSAIREETGHADLATALAIALPIALEEVGKRPVFVGAIDSDMRSPFAKHRSEPAELHKWERENDLHRPYYDSNPQGFLEALSRKLSQQ